MYKGSDMFWMVFGSGHISYYLNNADKNREQLEEEAGGGEFERARDWNEVSGPWVIEAVQPSHGGNHED